MAEDGILIRPVAQSDEGQTAESLASEDASRLASMQNAERNIQERLDELTAHYHHVRQDSITAELLDIRGEHS